MPYETISDGLTITIPTNTTQGWGSNLKEQAWKKISAHDHTGGGNGTQIGTGALANESVTSAKLAKNIAPTQAAALTPSGTTQTVDFNNGNKQILDLSSATGTVTLTLSNMVAGADYRIKIIEGATVRQLVWPAAVKFPQAAEPSQFFEANSINVVYLDYDGSIAMARWEMSLG